MAEICGPAALRYAPLSFLALKLTVNPIARRAKVQSLLIANPAPVDIERARSPFQDIGGNRLFAKGLAGEADRLGRGF
jgi:hypothetical protein